MIDSTLKKEIKDVVAAEVRELLKSGTFTDRKLADTPTDALSVVNRRYITLNGTTANRPTSPVTGQRFFDTTLGYPIFWNGSNWVNSSGTTV